MLNSTFPIYSNTMVYYGLHTNVVRSCGSPPPPQPFMAFIFVVLETDLPFKAITTPCFSVELRFFNGKSESKLFDCSFGKTHAERILFRLWELVKR